MSDKQWKLVTWSECPVCGNDAETLSDPSDGEGGLIGSDEAWDGDDARCCSCHWPGCVSCDSETEAHIIWQDEPIKELNARILALESAISKLGAECRAWRTGDFDSSDWEMQVMRPARKATDADPIASAAVKGETQWHPARLKLRR